MRNEDLNLSVRVLAESVVSPLGADLEGTVKALRSAKSGVRSIEDPSISSSSFYGASVDHDLSPPESRFGREDHPLFERFCIAASEQAIASSGVDPEDPSLVFVIATTKGNIDLIGENAPAGFEGREYLGEAGKRIAKGWGNPDPPWVLSNACSSGTQAIDTAADLIRADRYKRAVVIGGDILSAFTVRGFQAFLALASGPCRPYDRERDGLNLGEGAAALVLEQDEGYRKGDLYVAGGASSNDANHISGPSRTGEGLALAIDRALRSCDTEPSSIDHLNAHGTATLYNDEMEAKAFERVGLSATPMNSYKGALGHSLGAAGIIESAITLNCMREQELLPSLGYEEHGVSRPLNVIRERERANLSTCLKTSSGFGGCNAALIFKRG